MEVDLAPPPSEESLDLASNAMDGVKDTESLEDFVSQVSGILGEDGPVSKYQRRVVEGVRYIQVTFGGTKTLMFRADWLDK